jgi:hypothetical protein
MGFQLRLTVEQKPQEIQMNTLRKVALIFGVVGSLSSLAHAATVSLLDQFDDGNIATNTGLGGVGTGFTTSYVNCGTGTGASASESNGNVTVSGASCVHWMQSKDAIDPTQTTMIWSITSRPSTTSQGVLVGWVQAGKDACCETGVYLMIEGHRVTLDLQAKSGGDPFQPQGRYFEILAGSTTSGEVFPGFSGGPLTAILSLNSTGWQVSIHGDGVAIDKSGSYSSCPNPVNGQCIGLADILSYSGVNGTLRAVAGAFRENESATFDSVLVVHNNDYY